MEGSLQKIVSAIVGVMILFIVPVYIAFEKVDDISYSLVLKFTQSFVDNVRANGYISPEMYVDFVSNIYSTGNSYDIEIEHVKKRYDPVIYIYDFEGNILYSLDYEKYAEKYELCMIDNNTPFNVNGITYRHKKDCLIKKGHAINEERITDKQIVNKLFKETTITKEQFLSDYISGNIDFYNSLSYLSDNSYTMNEDDEITVTVKNRNRTVASTFYSMFTANVGDADSSKIYVEYGGHIKNDGGSLLTSQYGSVYSEEGRLFKFSGVAEEITLPVGEYTIECWGASGGGYITGASSVYTGGKGAYTKGTLEILNDTQTLYIYVGGEGSKYDINNTQNGGWNGGGNSYLGYGGGGASDIRLVKGDNDNDWSDTTSLLTRIMVAAGGGGSSLTNGFGGFGGQSDGGNLSISNISNRGLKPDTTSIITYNGYTDSLTGVDPITGLPLQASYENGGLGIGGRADYLGAGAGGSGFFGGSASHNQNAGGGGGLSYVYGTSLSSSNPSRIVWQTYQSSYEALSSSIYTGNSFSGKWANVKIKDIEYKAGNDNTIPNPLLFLGTSTLEGNLGNGFIRIKEN